MRRQRSEPEGRGRNGKLFTLNFTLLLLGQAVSLLGNGALRFALSMYVLEETGSAAVFGTFLAGAMVPTVLLSPFGGVLADRGDRRLVMAGLDLAAALAAAAAAAVFAPGRGVATAAALLFALSVLGAFESPTVQACVPQMHSGENLLRGNAAVNQIGAVTGLAAPFLGSLLYAAWGVCPVLWGAAGCFLLTAALECLIRLPRVERRRGQRIGEMLREELLDSVRFLARERREVLDLLLFAALCSFFAVGVMLVGLPYFVREELGLSAQLYGAAESAMGLAAVLGSLAAGLLVGRLAFARLNRLVTAMGVWVGLAGGALALPAGPLTRYGLLVAASCAGQAAACIFSIFALSAIQQKTPAHMTGKVMACVSTVTLCAQPLGQIVFGLALERLSGWAVLAAAGGALCVLGLRGRGLFARWAEEDRQAG